MHAVVAYVTIPDYDQATDVLDAEGSALAGLPGVVAMYYLDPPTGSHEGIAVLILESEDAARELAGLVKPGTEMSNQATVHNVEVRNVGASSGTDAAWNVHA
jgi:hypothetical protein